MAVVWCSSVPLAGRSGVSLWAASGLGAPCGRSSCASGLCGVVRQTVASPPGWRWGPRHVAVDRARQRRVPALRGGGRDRRLLPRPGRGARGLAGSVVGRVGLSGVVDASSLRALVQGQDPRTWADLLAGHRDRKVAVWDATISAPKSVSLLWAFGSRRVATIVMHAHVDAVGVAMRVSRKPRAFARRQEHGVRVPGGHGRVRGGELRAPHIAGRVTRRSIRTV